MSNPRDVMTWQLARPYRGKHVAPQLVVEQLFQRALITAWSAPGRPSTEAAACAIPQRVG